MKNSSELYQLIGQNLSSIRREYSIGTQEKLAEETGLSLSFISQIESKKVDKGISLDTLLLISQRYNIDIRRFFDHYEDFLKDDNE